MANELLNSRVEYRDHYIRVRVEADEWGPEVEEATLVVEIYDGMPPGSGLLSFSSESVLSGDLVHSFEETVPRLDYEDEATDALERAKEKVDAQKVNEFAARESVAIAAERTLSETEDA